MIPRWKLERELNRIKEQLQQLPWYVYGGLAKKHYDLTKQRKTRITKGKIPLGRNAAVLLIFQPRGILASTFKQLDYLNARGVSTLVVSNVPVNRDDMAKLQQKSFQILERPNYGYDFGGYRDGVLHILEQGVDLHNLFVMNDSVWLPVHKDSDPVGSAISDGSDLFGISYATHSRKPHRSHIQSYFFRFGRKVLEDPFFKEYWRDLPVSSNKYTVVRKCEMGLTQAFLARGYSIGVMQNDKSNLSHMLSLNDVQMRDLVKYLSKIASLKKANPEDISLILDQGGNWKRHLQREIEQNEINVSFLDQHPTTMLEHCKTPVLKKYSKEPYKTQRGEMRRLKLLGCINSEIADEIETWDSE